MVKNEMLLFDLILELIVHLNNNHKKNESIYWKKNVLLISFKP